MKETKKIFWKYIAAICFAVLLVLIFGAEKTKAAGAYGGLFDEGEFEISSVTQVDKLEVDVEEDKLSFRFSLEREEFSGKGDLYKLEGAGLYYNALVADITESSGTILFCSVSKGPLLLYSVDDPAFTGKMMLTCIVRCDETRKIYIVKVLLDEKTGRKAEESLKNITAIDMEHPIYFKVYVTGTAIALYEKENRDSWEREAVEEAAKRVKRCLEHIVERINSTISSKDSLSF